MMSHCVSMSPGITHKITFKLHVACGTSVQVDGKSLSRRNTSPFRVLVAQGHVVRSNVYIMTKRMPADVRIDCVCPRLTLAHVVHITNASVETSWTVYRRFSSFRSLGEHLGNTVGGAETGTGALPECPYMTDDMLMGSDEQVTPASMMNINKR